MNPHTSESQAAPILGNLRKRWRGSTASTALGERSDDQPRHHRCLSMLPPPTSCQGLPLRRDPGSVSCLPLDRLEDVRDRREQVRLSLRRRAKVKLERVARALGRPLQQRSISRLARLLGSLLDNLVLLYARQVARHALRRADMLNAHMNALDDLLLAVNLVNLHTNSTLVDVPHLAGAAVVVLVRHTLLLRSVADNIHHISHLVPPHEGGERRVATLCPELLREQVTGAGPVTGGALVSVTHGA
mmetsp:Transcript_43847/g.99103  ORF Transcript_43847/g.99103 Transcript_43847/m.99103 type:complete len:245 (+) Transcript_43847:312-1046(+)